VLTHQQRREGRTVVKMLDVFAQIEAVYQNPLNFGSSVGFYVVGAKVYNPCSFLPFKFAAFS
jgi:exopolysaccharide biosynthesis protein